MLGAIGLLLASGLFEGVMNENEKCKTHNSKGNIDISSYALTGLLRREY